MNLTKIISKDDLKPALKLAVLINGYFYATNAHIAIKIKADTVEYFNMNGVDNKVFDKTALTAIAKAHEVEFYEDYFVCRSKNGIIQHKIEYSGTIDPVTSKISMSKFSSEQGADGGIYPNIDAVIPEDVPPFEIGKMGINPKLLSNLESGFVGDFYNGVCLEFTGENRVIKVTPVTNLTCTEQVGIIMPIKVL